MSEMVESSLSAVGRRLYDRLRPRWALVGRKRGNTAKSAIRPKGKLRIGVIDCWRSRVAPDRPACLLAARRKPCAAIGCPPSKSNT